MVSTLFAAFTAHSFFALWEIASKKNGWILYSLALLQAFGSSSLVNGWMVRFGFTYGRHYFETGVGFILGTVLGAIIATFLWRLPLLARASRSISRRPKRHAKSSTWSDYHCNLRSKYFFVDCNGGNHFHHHYHSRYLQRIPRSRF